MMMFKRIVKIVSFSLILYFTVIAMKRVFSIDLDHFDAVFPHFPIVYSWVVDWPFGLVEGWFFSMNLVIPDIVRELLVFWFSMGRVVRKSIGDIAARSDAMEEKYNPRPKVGLQENVRQFLCGPVFKESVLATFFWPYRLLVDLKGTYSTHREYHSGQVDPVEVKTYDPFIFWELSPKGVAIYLGLSVVVLGVLMGLNASFA